MYDECFGASDSFQTTANKRFEKQTKICMTNKSECILMLGMHNILAWTQEKLQNDKHPVKTQISRLPA